MGKQENSSGWLRTVGIWLLTGCVIVGVLCLGIVCRPLIPNAWIGFVVSIAILAVLFIGNLAAAFLFKKWLSDQNVQQKKDYSDARKQRMEKNPTEEFRRMRLIFLGIIAYMVLLYLSVFSIAFFSGAANIGVTSTCAVLIFLAYGLVDRFFSAQPKPDLKYALPENEYSLLYELVRNTTGLTKTVKLYIFLGDSTPDEECNASVVQQGNEIYLLLGPMLLCVATEDELKQVFLHEFAHIQLHHTKQTLRYEKLMNYLSGDGHAHNAFSVWADWATLFPTTIMLFEGQNYFLLSSREKESDADSLAANAGQASSQASVMAKLDAHNLFVYEEEPYVNLYRTEEIPEHFATERIYRFREALISREQDWRRILENELPAHVASHPTFRQRWDVLGNCSYSLQPAAQEGNLARQCWAAAAESDRRMHEIAPERYSQLRKENYLAHLELVKAFEKVNDIAAPEEMAPVILAYYHLGMPEKAEDLCDQVIANNDSIYATAFARYWKGYFLLHRYDKTGLDYIYQAMETNRNYIDMGLNEIGTFCTRMGLEAELQEYREKAVPYMQYEQDHSVGGIHAKAQLSPEKLPEGWQDQILKKVLQYGQTEVQQVYLVHEKVSEIYAPSAFVLRFRENTDETIRQQIYDKVFRLLDDWPVDWEFALYEYENEMERILKKVPGACIYDATQE